MEAWVSKRQIVSNDPLGLHKPHGCYADHSIKIVSGLQRYVTTIWVNHNYEVNMNNHNYKFHGMVVHVKRKGQHSDLHVDIFMVLKNLHIIEIRRGKGDAIAYSKFMAKIGPLISKEIGIRNQGPSGIAVADATAADGAPALPAPSV